MIRFCFLLSVLSLASSACASLRSVGGTETTDIKSAVKGVHDDNDEEANHRSLGVLLSQRVPCAGRSGPINWFKVQFEALPQGGFNTNRCTNWKKKLLAKDINQLLLSYGIGNNGGGDDASFLAEVCQNPQRRRLLWEADNDEEEGARRLRPRYKASLVYPGGGKCRFCPEDSDDARRDLSEDGYSEDTILDNVDDEHHRELNDGNGDPFWFKNTYAPELQNALRNGFTNDVAPNHVACLGRGPRVNVKVTQVREKPSIC